MGTLNSENRTPPEERFLRTCPQAGASSCCAAVSPPRLLLLCLPTLALSAAAQPPPAALTTIAAVRNLPRPQAEKQLPVRVRAVVTYDSPQLYGPLLIQDGTAGIFVFLRHPSDEKILADIPETLTDIPVGTLLEIEGITGPGDYAPVIEATRVRDIGQAPVPSPLRPSVPELHTGRFDCQQVHVRGVTQTAVRNATSRQIDFDLVTELGPIVFHIEDDPALDLRQWVNAEVSVNGVCLMYFNRRNEQVGTHLQVGNINNITVHTPPPPDPFDVPRLDFSRLRPFSPEPRPLHRTLISGTVTYVEPQQFLILQNGDRAVRVNLQSHPPLQVGDLVEAAGFVEVREFYAELGNALVRSAGAGAAVVPVAVDALRVMGPPGTLAQRLQEDFDGRLITMDGNLVAVEPRREGGQRLLVETNRGIIEAALSAGTSTASLTDIRPGSRLRLTGVCMVTYTEKPPARTFPRPRSFEIILRSPADIQLLQSPSWWTAQRLQIALGIMAGGTLLSVAWVWTLRRRVAQRARELAVEIEARQNAEVEFEVTLRERTRLAADLHDTLEQSLNGLARQLEAADVLQTANPQRSGQHLGLARQLLNRSQEDVRRSVWNLRSESLEDASLAEALQQVAEHRSIDEPITIKVEVTGPERVLPDFVSGNLLLLAQEGITNAFKHAAATRILLQLAFLPGELTLKITDDGHGFDPAAAPGPRDGHFGIQGMRERLKRMGGRLAVESIPGQGTTVTAHLRN